jgi:WD40 repeat protein
VIAVRASDGSRGDIAMRDDEVIPAPSVAAAGTVPQRCRTGRTKFRLWSRGRIVLLVAALVGLAWLPKIGPPPGSLPMHRARGGSASPIVDLAFRPDGQTIATTDALNRVRLRSAGHGGGIDRCLAARGQVVAFSPDARLLGVGSTDAGVILCDLARGGEERPLGPHLRGANALCFSPDGQTVAISIFRSPDVLLWDLPAGRPRITLPGHPSPTKALAFAPDGRSLAVAAHTSLDHFVRVWDLSNGRPRHSLTIPCFNIASLAYSPDGRLLATAAAHENSVRIWDIRTGGLARWIAGHSLPTLSVAFSADGRLLATAGGDGFARLWSVATGRELRRLDGQADLLRKVAFSPDGRTLAATGNDDDIRLWDLGDLIQEMSQP